MISPLHIFLIVMLTLIIIFVVATFAVGQLLVSFSLKRHGYLADRAWKFEPVDINTLEKGSPKYIIETNYQIATKQIHKWLETAHSETLSITSRDGLNLVGHIFPAKEPTHNWLVLVHGFRDIPVNILNYATEYIKRGYNIFYMDHRAHGDSEGKNIGMAYPEHYDLLDWLDIICKRDPEASIVLHGHSMGASTIMMASGEADFPSNVVCAIADCGFSSINDEFKFNLKRMFHLPAFPFLYAANLVSIVETGLNFNDGDVIPYIRKSNTPTLFIHGDSDIFVPTDMVYKLYDAASCEKQLYVAIGAAHVDSRYIDPELYYSKVFDFIDKYRIPSRLL